MLYTSFLEKLFGNRTKLAMLKAFYRVPDKLWTSRDMAKFVGTYNTTILDNLSELEEMGLIQIAAHGRAKTIKLNKQSFVFIRIVKPLFEAESKAFEELLSDLKTIINPRDIKLLALFGSVAEHKEKPNSDIDILIVTDKKEKIEKIIEEKQGAIAKKFGNELSPHIFTSREFRQKQRAPFLKDAKKAKIILYGEWE